MRVTTTAKIIKLVEHSFCVRVYYRGAVGRKGGTFTVLPDGPGYNMEAMRSSIKIKLESEGYMVEWKKDGGSWFMEVKK